MPSRLLYPLAVALLAAAMASLNFAHGYAGDMDGHFLYQRAIGFPHDGYLRSRSWGFPAYELVTYPLVAYLGAGAAKAYALACYVAGAVVLFGILARLGASSERAALGAGAFVVLPVAVISGNTILETSQGVLLALLALYGYVAFTADAHPRQLYLSAVSAGLASSSRPEYIILSAALAITVLRFHRPPIGTVVLAALLGTFGALGPFALYPRLEFNLDVVLPDPYWQLIARAALGNMALLGLPALLLLGLWVFAHRPKVACGLRQVPHDDLLFLFVVCLALFEARFVIMPDELEYIVVLVPLLLVVLVHTGLGSRKLVALGLALALPNLTQPYVFRREPTGGLVFDLGVSPGAIAQDRSARLRLDYLDQELPAIMRQIAARYGRDTYAIAPSDKAEALVIMPEEQLRFYQPDRHGGRYYNVACSQTLVVYPMPADRGWRHFTRFEPWRPVGLEEFSTVHLPACG